jgi:hypothetical protein
LRILTAVKKARGGRVTIVFARQGHYAADPKILASYRQRISAFIEWENSSITI